MYGTDGCPGAAASVSISSFGSTVCGLAAAVRLNTCCHEQPPSPLWRMTAPLVAVSYFAFGPWQMKFTALATMTTFLFGYEWTHFLIHSPYVPRSRIFRAVWRAHILHHYKNEKYWFGVTNPIADHVLRTFPAKASVPSSPTARTLGVDDELTLLSAPS